MRFRIPAHTGAILILSPGLFLAACGGGSGGIEDALEACKQWAVYLGSEDDSSVAVNRAVAAAERASADTRFEYLATDMKTAVAENDQVVAEGFTSAIDGGGSPDDVAERILASAGPLMAASKAVGDSCESVGVDFS